MTDGALFPDLPDPLPKPESPAPLMKELRYVVPVRNQVEMMLRCLDSLLPESHRARTIWAFIEKLDLSDFYNNIRAVTDGPGRPATDPKVLLALWVYGTVEGIGSARHLARLCVEHDAYRWLRGEVPVNYHLLSDFRVQHGQAMNDLLTQIVAVLMKTGVVELNRVSQDGIRVRASAGQSSFRREASLYRCLKEAEEQVERLAREREHPDPGVTKRQRAARERAARERKERVEEALRELPEVKAVKERQAKHAGKARAAKLQEPRVSTTDAKARTMKMPDGGFRPGYNVQLASDTGSQVILGVASINKGTDQGQALPMEKQVAEDAGRHPNDYLIDGGFVDLQDIRELELLGVKVYAPPKETGTKATPRGVAATPQIVAWRERMQTEEAKTIYKERAATSECVNAQMRARYGLTQFTVRGLAKVTCVALLLAVTHNLSRWISLSN